MKYFIIAGEVSGDLQVSKIMRYLKKVDKEADFRYMGGDLMQAEGGTLIKHIKEMAFMWFVYVLMNLRTIKRTLDLCKRELLNYKPDVLILVDYPSFNFRMAKFAKQHKVKVYYFIPPKIWAWKEYRIKQIKRNVDKIFSILPFEVEFYKGHNYPINYIGNPLVDNIDERSYKDETFSTFLQRNKIIDKRSIVALLSGSRKQEIKKILPVMLKMIKKFPQYQFIIAGVKTIPKELYSKLTKDYDVKIIYDETYPLLQQAKAALVTSGTATLETALLNVPQVVCYKFFGGRFAYNLYRFVANSNLKYISLVNLIMNKMVVKELIQHYLTEDTLEAEMKNILENKSYKQQMFNNYKSLKKKVGEKGAAERTAKLMYKYLKEGV